MIKSGRILSIFVLACGLVPNTVLPALPAVIDGQPLPSLAPMLERVTPGVVNIATRGRMQISGNPLLDDPFFRHFFNIPQQPREQVTQSLGSGVIVDARKGYILTNNHVIENADEIVVTLRDGRELEARLVGSDPDSDVAVVQVDADNLTAVPWGNSEKLRVGDFVVAIGNPFGLGQTVTDGIVSALDRSGLGIERFENFIQTNAQINPGNSGGALVDLNGRLVGINTAIIGPAGGNVGIGFAIPSVMARQIMQQLVEHGVVRRGRLGIAMQDINAELARAFGLKQQRGVVISQVEAKSPADKAGLRAGDIVTEVNGRAVRSAADMSNVIGLQRIGQIVEMKLLRDAQTIEIKAVIDEKPVKTIAGNNLHPLLDGATLGEASTVINRPDIPGLVVIELRLRSPASEAGLRRGDIITSVNRQLINSIDEATLLIKRSHGGVLLNIRRGDSALFLVLR
jgi:serine protease Do/serine protease DegQ